MYINLRDKRGTKCERRSGLEERKERRVDVNSHSMLLHQGPDCEERSEQKDVLDNHSEDSENKKARHDPESEGKEKEKRKRPHINERVDDARGRTVSRRV